MIAVDTAAGSPTRAPLPTIAYVLNSTPDDTQPIDDAETPSPTITPIWDRIAQSSPAPTGQWTSIHWYAGPRLTKCVPEADQEDESPDCPVTTVFGWSHGYVFFSATDTRISYWSSADGLNWSKAGKLDTKGLDSVYIEDLVEGPAGILAIGKTYRVGTCAPPDLTVYAMWLSTEGTTWTKVSSDKSLKNGIQAAVDASSRGYIATGWESGSPSTDPSAPMVWISSDARTWQLAPLPFGMIRSGVIDGPVSFGQGYLLYGEEIMPGGCGGNQLERSAIWYTADGQAWAKTNLPDVVTGADVETDVFKINGLLVAQEYAYDSSGDVSNVVTWTSADGQNWTRVARAASLSSSNNTVVTDGRRSLVYIGPEMADDGETVVSPASFNLIDAQLRLVPLKQQGPAPNLDDLALEWGDILAIGPTGIVVTDGEMVWLAIPVVG